VVFAIGIDPHKGSHSAAVLDEPEELVDEVRVRAGRRQRDELVSFASRFEPRCWAIEGATGTGALLAQQLVAVGETVLDVPPSLSARARLLDTARIDKTDAHDARSAAVVALRHSKLRAVVLEDHTAVLRLLAKRHHDLVAHRTRTVCRLHTVLCLLVAGGLPRQLSATRAAAELRRIHPSDQVGIERRRLAMELLTELRTADRDLAALKVRITTAVAASSTTVTDVVGVGSVMAAYLIGYTGDVRRFPTAWALRPLQRHRTH
jgi:transposase